MVDSALSDSILNQGPEVTNELDITDAVGQGITNDNEVSDEPEIIDGVDLTNERKPTNEVTNEPEIVDEVSQEATFGSETTNEVTNDPEITNEEGQAVTNEPEKANEVESETSNEKESAQPIPLRRSHRIIENPRPTIDPELISENDDPNDVDFS